MAHGENLIMSNIEPKDGKFLARYSVGTRLSSRLCDTKDEATEFIKNGIRSECGFSPTGQKGGLER